MYNRALFPTFAAVILAGALAVSGQQASPSAAQDLDQGKRVFSEFCASCHGAEGLGGRGPALAANSYLQQAGDDRVLAIVRDGTSNGMPGFASMPPADLKAVVALLRAMNPTGTQEAAAAGDANAGETFFFGKGQCSTCHLALGRGSAIGPDLSNLGERMSAAEIERSLTAPAGAIARAYEMVRVELPDGRTLRGFPRNEGNYVLPLQTLEGKLVVVSKRGTKITPEPGSVMPPLTASAEEKRDLLAYLTRLRGGAPLPPLEPSGSERAESQEILKPRAGDWPTYHGRFDANRYSPLKQITTENANSLSLQWMHSLRGFDNEMTPLVLDGIMYITAPNQVSALDAASGREIWRYSRPQTPGIRGDAARGINRGVAVHGSRVFFVTDNAHLIALSRANGALLWEVVLPEDPSLPYGGTTAPLVINDLVVAGVSGGDEGIRGFLAAYHVTTGKQVWRFWTVPQRGDAAAGTWQGEADLSKAGGATWLPGSYDPETDTLYWPTGNPYPDTDGSERKGDNLYTNSVLALDAKTGKLRWHFQFTPHDLWDWDAEEPLLLVDTDFQGQARKLLLQANRNGFFYVLDRTTGKFLRATPFVKKLTWASGVAADGRPVLVPGNTPNEEGVTTCPAIRGATNWMSTSYSPATRLFYVMSVENCFTYRSTMFGGGGRARGPQPAAPGRGAAGRGAGGRGVQGGGNFGIPGGGFNRGGAGGGGSMLLRALDVETGKIAWEIPQVGNSNNYVGTLATAGGLVFYGQASGEFAAVDAKTGKNLWHFETQETWKASPMTYMVNGRQYVAIVSGANILSFALPEVR